MKIFKNSILALLLTISTMLHSMELANKSDNYSYNTQILCRSPHYFWDKDKPKFHWGLDEPKGGRKTMGSYTAKGSAGIIPYFLDEDETYILIGRETWGPDKGKYCNLGGAIEVIGDNTSPCSTTFLETLICEGREESGNMYQFDKEDILKNSKVFSYVHTEEGYYNKFESVLAFQKVPLAYCTREFLQGSQEEINKRNILNLCTWCYEEKDDYQWIKWDKLIKFLIYSNSQEGVFKNIEREKINVSFRSYFIEMLRAPEILARLANLKLI